MRGRIRTIKPEVHSDEELWDAEQESGLPLFRAYVGLWNYADREGRFEWKLRRLKAAILPFWDGDFGAVLDALASHGFIVKYEADDKVCGWVRTFSKHQQVNGKEAASALPPPPVDARLSRDSRETHATSTRDSREDDATVTREGKENHAPIRSLPFPSVPEGVQGEPPGEVAPKPKPPDPCGDAMRGQGPGARADVLKLHEAFRVAVERPGLKFRNSYDLDAVTLAESIDTHGLPDCLLVAAECINDRMVNGQADDKGMPHKSVKYVFGNVDAFARILAAAHAKRKKIAGRKSIEDLQREVMSAEADLSDYRPPPKREAS